MRIELRDGDYIDSWYDRHTRCWITQLKDKDGYEIDCAYSGNRQDRDYEIGEFKDLYAKGEYIKDEALVEETNARDIERKANAVAKSTARKTKKAKLNPFLSMTPIMPDQAAGIGKFNASFGGDSAGSSGGGEASGGGMGESLEEDYLAPHGLTLDQYKAEIKKRRPGYTFDRLNKVSKNKEAVAFMELDRIMKQDAERKAEKDVRRKPAVPEVDTSDYELVGSIDGNDVYFDGEYYYMNNIKFESEEAIKDYLSEGMNNKMYYLNDLHEAWDVEEDITTKPLTESVNRAKRVPLQEQLRELDKREFNECCECHELELLYEANKLKLSAQDKNDISNFARKSNSFEEIADYIQLKAAESQKNEALNEADGEGSHFQIYDKRVKDSGYTDEEIAKVIDIADKYEAKAQRHFITPEQMDEVADMMGLAEMPDSELMRAWRMYYDILSRESFTDEPGAGIEKYKKYGDAASAFAEVINREARRRKEAGTYNPYEESLTEAQGLIPEDQFDGWSEEDIDLYKTTDWKARNYQELPVPEDSFDGYAQCYGNEQVEEIPCHFIKYIRANAIFPPYYAPEEKPCDGYVGPMFDGRVHNGLGVHDRYETAELYDLLTR